MEIKNTELQDAILELRKFHDRLPYLLATLEVARGKVEKHRVPATKVRQTSCKHCGLDVESYAPFLKGTWHDRGGDTRCQEDSRLHEGSV